MAPYKNTLIIANRSPIDFRHPVGEGEDARLTVGGLVSGMSGLLKDGSTTWVGMAGGMYDFHHCLGEGRPKTKAIRVYDPGEHRVVFNDGTYDFAMKKVFLPKVTVSKYYNRFCNGFLWPLMHITYPEITKSKTFPMPTFNPRDYMHYKMANTTFANAAIEEYPEGTGKRIPIWVQDYHFMLVPNKLRELEKAGENPLIGQFIHIPFFGWFADEVMRGENGTYSSTMKDLLEGMLGNDLLGFHVPSYVEDFADVAKGHLRCSVKDDGDFRVIEHNGRRTYLGAFPIGVDVETVLSQTGEEPLVYMRDDLPKDGGLSELIEKRRKKGFKILTGLERMDYTKGVVERLKVVERLLEMGENVTYIGFSSPSRGDSPGYKELAQGTRKVVDGINERFKPFLGFEPIVWRKDGIYPPQNYRLMRDADVVMVTSLEDGFNLVIPEGILAKKYADPENRGPMVIGRCGASHELRDFGEDDGLVRIDPLDVNGSAETVRSTMDRNVSDRLISHVETRMDISEWRDRFMSALYDIA